MKAEGLNPNIIICWDSLTLIPTYNRPRRLVMKAESLNPNIIICWDSLTLIPTYLFLCGKVLILPYPHSIAISSERSFSFTPAPFRAESLERFLEHHRTRGKENP
jgi:hypothetical protein